ncbi:hypothetical protein CK203_090960 [Vitis vinifera]|uniref:Uncharacterized protein n=1 Tax=Vitis vinifera TaxID=29760 RepID=A0A438CM74_VITVI|nr:hypothetical protein CK203_090960 [Vitis vinifera]
MAELESIASAVAIKGDRFQVFKSYAEFLNLAASESVFLIKAVYFSDFQKTRMKSCKLILEVVVLYLMDVMLGSWKYSGKEKK